VEGRRVWVVDKGRWRAIQFKFRVREISSGAPMRCCTIANFFGGPIKMLGAGKLAVTRNKAQCASAKF
jgi:hypothetical protein